MQNPEVAMSSTFLPPQADVVLEAFADESIAVNLAVGRYYSLDLVAAEVHGLLTQGCPLEAVVEELARRYEADPAVVGPAVVDFTVRLLEEDLIAPAPEGTPGAAVPRAPGSAGGFSVPKLSVYTDMEDLLLLDPIHDVDEAGWPVRRDAGESAPSDRSETG